ncbi:hypothetical protein BH11BAC3_BH11BAC3_29190 [soil metagenome]
MAIEYVRYQQIDPVKWDACIAAADNGLIYGYSIYLNNMAANWDALVLNDYEMVMPLTWNKKYGFYYLYQPFFTACLGVFGNNISGELVEQFLKAIPSKFKYWDICLNHGNYFQLNDFDLYERMNYVLDLQLPYETIYAAFKDNIKRNVKKAVQLNCVIKKDIPVKDVIALASEQSKNYAPIKEADYNRFKNLYEQLHEKNLAVTYGVYAPNEKLVASCVLFYSHKRIYYILVGNHPNGKTIGASHALLNAFIKDHAGQDLLLDFEGSDIRNLAFFYSSYGATQEKYAGIKLNRLPKLARMFKQ